MTVRELIRYLSEMKGSRDKDVYVEIPTQNHLCPVISIYQDADNDVILHIQYDYADEDEDETNGT